MTFVFPLLLGGLALITVPIVIHLILRQKPKTLKFPAFRFLVKRYRTNLRKLQLRHLLLLLLRILLLTLICLALARPKILSDMWDLSTDRPVAAILLFDTSYSMEYKLSDGQNRLEDAKKRGLELLDQLPAGSQVAVLDTAEPVGSGAAEWLTSAAQARQWIGALRLRHDSAAVTARLKDAFALFAKLASGKDRRLPRLLCVFSDRTTACWDPADLAQLHDLQDAVPPPGERMALLQGTIPARVALLKELRQRLPPPQGKDYPEQPLIDLWEQVRPELQSIHPDTFPDGRMKEKLKRLRLLQRQLREAVRELPADTLSDSAKEYRGRLEESLESGLKDLQGVYAFFVDVGVEKATDLAILKLEMRAKGAFGELQETFAPDDTIILSAHVQATGQDFDGVVRAAVGDRPELPPQLVSLRAGERTIVSFEIDCQGLGDGPHQVQVSLGRPDLLEFTNRRFATFVIRRARPILIVTDDSTSVRQFKKAIEELKELRFVCEVISPTELIKLGPAALTKYPAVYLFNVAHPTQPMWSALKVYAEQGGGVGIIPAGENLDRAAYGESKEARSLLPGRFVKAVRAVEQTDQPGLTWHWNDPQIYKHPLLATFGQWRRMGDVDFFKAPRRAIRYWLVEPQENEGSVLVWYNDSKKEQRKDPALLERKIGNGKVVLLTTKLGDKEWNNFLAEDTSFVVVLPGEITKYLAGDREKVPFHFTAGREVPWLRLPLTADQKTFTLEGPGTVESVARPDDRPEIYFRKATTPGNYVVNAGTGEGGDRIGAFSLNFAAEEANLTRAAAADIEKLFGAGAVVPLSYDVTLRSAMQGYWSEPSELYPWLLLALLVFLLLEVVLANLFYRREPQQ